MAASNAKKRQLPSKVAAMKAKKRRKLDEGQNAGSKASKTTTAPPPPKKVRLDQLAWNEVDMPDKMDDYEGFFGLEEIDGVDVVRDATGTMSFTSRAGNKDELAQEPELKADPTESSGSPADEGDDFAGFSDHEETSAPKGIIKATESKPVANKKAKPKPTKENTATKQKPTKENKATKQKPTPAKSAFDVIQEEASDDVDISAWKSLKLSPDTLAGLSKLKFASPTPIQQAAIPDIMAGNDVIGKASTGSGKTLAFGIPIFETYLDRKAERAAARTKGSLAPLALIISPTRELAHQISQHLQDLGNGLPNEKPIIATLTGGLSVQKQQRQLKNADVVVGTPGRLWEVISGGKDLIQRMQQVQFFVLDEADRLLSQGHYQELEEIFSALNRTVSNDDEEEQSAAEEAEDAKAQRQTLVFSATFQKDLQHKLARKQKSSSDPSDKKESLSYLIQRLAFRTTPRFIDVNPSRSLATNLREGIVECAGTEKDLYLYSLLLLHSTSRTLVFVNSISTVRRIVPFLQNLSVPALALHSQMAQKARLRSIERFTANTTSAGVLVATDVAARGLDIPAIDLVLHYHLPRAADAYIHRSGRTARAGASGSSVLLCSPDEVAGSRRLVAQVHARKAERGGEKMSRAEAARKGYAIRSLDLDRRVVQRLRPRAELAKRIADVEAAKEKKRGADNVWRQAAEDLGVEYDSEELEKAGNFRGRGEGRKRKERADREIGQDQVRAMRGELKGLLSQRVNVGVSERYPTSGTIDIDELLKEDGQKTGEFLGAVAELDMDG